MRYSLMVELYKKLESTTKKLEKTETLSGFYKKCPDAELYNAVVMSMGVVYPAGDKELGVAEGMIKKVIAKVTGASEKEVVEQFKKTGDLGSAVEKLMEKRKQRSLGKKDLTVDLVFNNLRKLPDLSGKGSQEKKVSLIAELLSSATPEEAKYIVRTALYQMRIGVAYGLVRDAIAKAFDKDKKEIERIFNLVGDYGLVAEKAKKGKLKAEIELGRPVHVMLAERGGEDVKEAMEELKDESEKVVVETKLDGFRVQLHKDGNDVKVFSRRMENVTNQFPDIVAWAKDNLKAKSCVVDGEAVAFDFNKNRTLAFQQLSRRIQRKYDIEKMVKEIPIQVNLFDVISLNRESMMDVPLKERWPKLCSIVKETKNFKIVDHIETSSAAEAEKFFSSAIKGGQEGVIVKNLSAHYQPGRRVGGWLKVKPVLEPLDLVIVGAEWGEGRKSKWLSSVVLACKKGSKLLETGRMSSGFTESQLEELTKKLKGLITSTEGKVVKIKPEVVIEIAYEEIQKSPKYESGYAFRFPRLLRIRLAEEKGPKDADTLQAIEKIYNMQRGRKK